MSEREVDVVVIGAGPAGEVCAGRLAGEGLEVAIVEEHLVGGECSFYACMPSKALLRPGELAAEVARVPGVPGGPLDVAAVLARRDEVVHELRDDAQLPWLEDRGIELVRARGHLDGERRVRAGEDVLVARRAVVLATGSAPVFPSGIDGLAEAAPWGNREATTAREVPARLAILGGGVVGVELAQAWSSLGAAVTVLEAADRVLAREEPFASEEVAGALRAAGVVVRLGAKASAVRRGRDGAVTISLEDGEAVEADELLVAIGRRPRTEDLGLESVGLEPGEPVEVDEACRAGGRDWLYAIGDVNGRAPLTHEGKYQARVVTERILGRDAALRPPAGGPPARVIFTDPAVAAVGHTEASAREAGLAVRCVDTEADGTAGASFQGRNAGGTCRFVLDTDRDVLVGATFTGPHVYELLHAATVAIVGEVPRERLWHAVPAFPTRSEVWLALF